MTAAAQAAAAAMRANRGEGQTQQPGGPTSQSELQAVSKGGVEANATGVAYGQLAEVTSKGGEWGKLPKKVAEQLSQGQQETMASEYRHQVETYYRVIAEKSKR